VRDYEIYRDKESELIKQRTTAGVTVEVVENSLDKVTALLAGVQSDINKAVGSALKRAAGVGKTIGKRLATKEYTISQSEFLAQTKNINHIRGTTSVSFGFKGYVIPLLRFNTCIDSNGRVVTQVRRQNTPTVLEHAFAAQMGGHSRRIYEREGPERFPVRQLFGPSTPKMMENADILEEMDAKMAEAYENRIDHEILAILNGWRK
jgi:ribosomal protein L18